MSELQLPARSLHRGIRLWKLFGAVLVNLLALALLVTYLFPMAYMVVTAIKENAQFLVSGSPIWPARAIAFTYQGEAYAVYYVPTDQGVKQWALVTPHRQASEFVDPARPEAGLIQWTGNWRGLKRVFVPAWTLTNFVDLWKQIDFPHLLNNTLWIVGLSELGVLISSVLVAYGFARFPVPAGKYLFILLIATILLPGKVTLIPTYFLYMRVFHWGGTWIPLILPHLFGNAIFIFLLRQNFKSIPKDVEEAAMLDGAGPVRTLVSILLPQAFPTVITMGLLQFFFAWNETQTAALYLGTSPDLFPLSFAVQTYGGQFFAAPNLLQASALMAMTIPIVVLFFGQRFFMQSVLGTGLEK